MNSETVLQRLVRRVQQRPALYGIVGLAVVALVATTLLTTKAPAPESTFYEVKRGDFLVSIVEGGTLEAVNEVVIRSEAEGTARIIFIVPEGSNVKKGQLLVELDSASSQDAVNVQQINVEKSQFALIQAQQQLEIQKSVVDSEIQKAELAVEFAQTDLDKYLKGEAQQLRRNAQIEITNVLEKLKIAQERLQWSEELFKQGFESKGNLDTDRLTVSTSQLSLEKAEKALWMLETFDEPKKKRELESLLEEAKEALERTKMQGERRLAQYAADVETNKKTLELSQTKLERDKKTLLATKILAPQDGLVVYASASGGHFSTESMIEEGAVVRNRQEIIKLPDVSEMKLKVKIHESHINQVQLGQPAYIVLDSMPDQRFQGSISKVAPLPDSQARWGNPDLKVYATEILITDKLPDVKPGVSARAEIVITNLQNVLTVPIQAVTTRRGKQVVYREGTPPEPVPVTVGLYNTKFIEISSGLKEGDRVLLAPPFDTQEKDLSGAIIAEGESVPKNGAAAQPNRPGTAPAGIGENQGGNRDPRSATRGANATDTASPPDAASRPPRANRDGMSGVEGSPSDPASAGRRGRMGGQEGPGGAAMRQEMLKQFDTNGDGQLDETERAAMRERFGRGMPGQEGGASRTNRQDLMKQFDTNGDGQIDETERAAMRERFNRQPRGEPAPSEPAAR